MERIVPYNIHPLKMFSGLEPGDRRKRVTFNRPLFFPRETVFKGRTIVVIYRTRTKFMGNRANNGVFAPVQLLGCPENNYVFSALTMNVNNFSKHLSFIETPIVTFGTLFPENNTFKMGRHCPLSIFDRKLPMMRKKEREQLLCFLFIFTRT